MLSNGDQIEVKRYSNVLKERDLRQFQGAGGLFMFRENLLEVWSEHYAFGKLSLI
jgi:hypothetical protein